MRLAVYLLGYPGEFGGSGDQVGIFVVRVCFGFFGGTVPDLVVVVTVEAGVDGDVEGEVTGEDLADDVGAPVALYGDCVEALVQFDDVALPVVASKGRM